MTVRRSRLPEAVMRRTTTDTASRSNIRSAMPVRNHDISQTRE